MARLRKVHTQNEVWGEDLLPNSSPYLPGGGKVGVSSLPTCHPEGHEVTREDLIIAWRPRHQVDRRIPRLVPVNGSYSGPTN